MLTTAVARLLCALGALFAGTTLCTPAPNAVGPTDPAAPPEVRGPAGPYTGQRPRAIILVIHGGAWMSVGQQAIERMRPEADRFRRRGYQTVSITYRPGAQSLTDVLARYDALRAENPRTPICALGASAGGHLALMLASRRRDLACVIAEAAPTDLGGLTDPTLKHIVSDEFAPRGLVDRWSPVKIAQRIKAPVLQAASANDPIVPYTQATDFHRALPSSRLVTIAAAGPAPATKWEHASADPGSVRRYFAIERRFVAAATRRTGR
jgi:acetyl esterase/lipase